MQCVFHDGSAYRARRITEGDRTGERTGFEPAGRGLPHTSASMLAATIHLRFGSIPHVPVEKETTRRTETSVCSGEGTPARRSARSLDRASGTSSR
ncbi:MAG: hypothetical protein CMJ34_13550 [Phycisphaerae bacterium]|nr:hypothetical protein [Phycisphaerae bacterium]